jgi:hypothetical protein
MAKSVKSGGGGHAAPHIAPPTKGSNSHNPPGAGTVCSTSPPSGTRGTGRGAH